MGPRRFGTAISSLQVENVREELIFVVFVPVYLKLGNDHLLRCSLQFVVIHSYVTIKPLVTDSTVKS